MYIHKVASIFVRDLQIRWNAETTSSLIRPLCPERFGGNNRSPMVSRHDRIGQLATGGTLYARRKAAARIRKFKGTLWPALRSVPLDTPCPRLLLRASRGAAAPREHTGVRRRAVSHGLNTREDGVGEGRQGQRGAKVLGKVAPWRQSCASASS